MIFGQMLAAEAEGAILAHSIHVGEVHFRKGRVLSAADIETLTQADILKIVGARLEAGDVPEDEAAAALADALAGSGIKRAEAFTGRANLYAEVAGLVTIDRARVNRINLLGEAITIATLAPFERVEARQMLATIKIIPYAVKQAHLDHAIEIAREAGPLISTRPFTPHKVGLVATTLPGMKASIHDKSRKVLEARLEAMGSRIAREIRCHHDEAEVTTAIRDLLDEGCSPVLIFGASATSDRADVVPAGIARAGGDVLHFGMPVDPGNLMLLARHGKVPVIGLPGCARSPALNGFDFVLARLLADLPVTPGDVMQMGVGGLLKEIRTRPQPRDGTQATSASAPRIAALILAGGRSSRMQGPNKLLAEIDGQPMVTHMVKAALDSQASGVFVVTGHQADKMRDALGGLTVTLAHNPDYADGLSTSLKAGLAALPEDIDGVIICLADMPSITPAHLNRLIAAFDPEEGRNVCVPTFEGKRGNPVLWGASFLDEMRDLKGDVGAKHLIGLHEEDVVEVPMPDDAPLRDIDTAEALADHRKR
ncbi:MAG: NTP transferase domain-containing protein [Rhizobiales bacterium]|nr:NTP transferase domain-containing protein [Hyphomicrobiales bacterium]